MTADSRLLMLGAAPETRDSIAAVVDVYRTHGLFQRWAIDYFPIHSDGTLLQRWSFALKTLPPFAAALARSPRVPVHLHASAGARFWRDAVFIGAARAARSPLILQLHGAGFEAFYDGVAPAARALIRSCLEQAACVAAPSESLCAWARSVTRRKAHVVCLPNPVSAHASTPRSARANLVLFLGKLRADKGIFDLLEALAALRTELPDLRLVCAGEGERIAVARYAERLGIAEAVSFTGWVGPSGKRALLEAAAVFALPSYDEAMPISLLEAMAAGLPVVSCAVGGIPEVVVDGVSGCLVGPGDKAGLARALRSLLTEREFAARIGAAAQETVRLRFAPERALSMLEQIYASVGLRARGDDAGTRLTDLRRAA